MLAAAMLCDAASVREGLLHILGGGITRSSRPAYPTMLGAVIALQFIVHREDFIAHEIAISVGLRGESDDIARLTMDIGAPEVELTDEPATLPIVVPLGVIIQAAGTYRVAVILDGSTLIELPLAMETGTP